MAQPLLVSQLDACSVQKTTCEIITDVRYYEGASQANIAGGCTGLDPFEDTESPFHHYKVAPPSTR